MVGPVVRRKENDATIETGAESRGPESEAVAVGVVDFNCTEKKNRAWWKRGPTIDVKVSRS